MRIGLVSDWAYSPIGLVLVSDPDCPGSLAQAHEVEPPFERMILWALDLWPSFGSDLIPGLGKIWRLSIAPLPPQQLFHDW